jgi:hypothetical protein
VNLDGMADPTMMLGDIFMNVLGKITPVLGLSGALYSLHAA